MWTRAWYILVHSNDSMNMMKQQQSDVVNNFGKKKTSSH